MIETDQKGKTAPWASILFGLLWVGGIVLGVMSYSGGTYDYKVTTHMAQEQIDAALKRPMTGAFRDLKFSNPVVRFADGKVYVQVHIEGVIHKFLVKRQVQADVFAVGKPDYHQGGFYFLPTETIRFENAKIERVEGGAFERTKELVKKHLEESSWGDVLKEFKPEFEVWFKDIAQKALSTALAEHPFYTLKNDLKGFEIKAVLEKVQVVDDVLHITLSIAQLANTIMWALFVLVCAIGFTCLFFMRPELFMIAAIAGG